MKEYDYIKKINDLSVLEERKEEVLNELSELDYELKLVKNDENYKYMDGVNIINKINKIHDEYCLLIERIETIKFYNKINNLKSNVKNFKICMLVKLNKLIEQELSKEKELIKKISD